MSEYLAESRRIRAEQDRAYAESLAADQEKEKAKVYVCMYVCTCLHNFNIILYLFSYMHMCMLNCSLFRVRREEWKR